MREREQARTGTRLWFVGVLLGLTACASPKSAPAQVGAAGDEPVAVDDVPTPPQAPAPGQGEAEVTQWPPAPLDKDAKEWVQLVSGEWLRGEIIALSQETLEFDSDELDDLKLSWDDITEVVTTRIFTIVRADRSTLVGTLHVFDGRAVIRTADGMTEYPSKEVMRLIQGEPSEWNYWSGKIRLSSTVRSGNTNQTDLVTNISAKRRTSLTRLDMRIDGVFSEVSGVESANNQTAFASHNIYLSPRFYFTTLGLELFRDRFQNIDLRVSPYVGGGYTVLDGPRGEWTLDAGLGYRYTRFESVTPPDADTSETGQVILGTTLDSDLTPKIELDFLYSASIGMEDVGDTNHDASIFLSLDFAFDLDLDVGLTWTHVGQPQTDANGDTPLNDDFRFEVGFSWDF